MIGFLFMIISVVAAAAYALLLFISFINFRMFRTAKPTGKRQFSVAVVVAARNEAHNIRNLLDALERQVTDQQFEVIIIDDASTDSTLQIARSHWAKKFRLNVLSSGGAGKKDALTTGTYATEAEIILVTDADCIPDPHWVQTMRDQFNDEGCHFVGGTVRPKEGNGIVESALATETIFLQVVSTGMFQLKNPMMCNGASMGFRRRFFFDVKGFTNDQYASGDDMALLQKAKLYGANSIRWVSEAGAMVETPMEETYAKAIEQRHRWLSKVKAYSGSSSYLTAILFLGMQLLLPLTLLTLLTLPLSGLAHNPFLPALEIKIVVELLLLSLAASFFRGTSIIFMFPVSVIVYCIISIGAAVRLVGGDVKWKDRTWKHGKVR